MNVYGAFSTSVPFLFHTQRSQLDDLIGPEFWEQEPDIDSNSQFRSFISIQWEIENIIYSWVLDYQNDTLARATSS